MDVTVLFSDIRDYTTLSEQMTPKDNFEFINAYNGRIGPIVQKNHGFINQFLGDAIMALFPHNPEDSLKATVEIQNNLRYYNEKRIKKRTSNHQDRDGYPYRPTDHGHNRG